MALADFFDKAALAASHILQGYDMDAFRDRLLSSVIGIVFDNAAVESIEGRRTLELSVNLLARLYPRIAILPLTETENVEAIFQELERIAMAINPDIDVARTAATITACVAVGGTPSTGIEVASPVIYIGSDGWIAKLSIEHPVGSGASEIPFGAGAAACFGAANVFRVVFGDQLPGGSLDRNFMLSLVDYEVNASMPSNPSLEAVDLGETHLVGLGAIGNGTIWALARTPHLKGVLQLVDNERIDLTNLQRYVLATQAHAAVQTEKVLLAVDVLKGSGLTVEPNPCNWAQYLGKRKDWYFERVGIAVDSAEDRRSAQACLPKWLVNAWTQPGDLGISRHGFTGDQACLTCLYFPEGGQKNEDELIAHAIGLPDKILQVREMLYLGSPVDRPWLEAIAAALGVSVGPLLRFEGQPLRRFYSEAICGGVVLQLGGHPKIGAAEVPMAFQSALAGIMLAAELVSHAARLKLTPPPATTKIDLLRPLGTYLSLPNPKHPSGRCICQDSDYQAAYEAKYA
jgi:hypothetical protein